MKVKELIEKLKEFDGELECAVMCYHGVYVKVEEICKKYCCDLDYESIVIE
jgi:hypothetical protein